MTEQDEPRFRKCYHWLCAAYSHKRDVTEYRVFLRTLDPLPIESIEAAALSLSRQAPSQRGSFWPKAPEFFAHVVRFERKRLTAEVERMRALPVAEAQRKKDLPKIERARKRAIRELRKRHPGAEKWLQSRVVNHPLDTPKVLSYVCSACCDTGRTSAGVCECADANPVIRLRRLESVALGAATVDRQLEERRSEMTPLLGE